MRFMSAVFFLGLSVMVAAGATIGQSEDSDEVHNPGTALRTNNREGRQSDLCTFFYNGIKDIITSDIRSAINAIALVPDVVITFITSLVLPGSQFFVIQFITCWRTVAVYQYGSDPTAANAVLEGDIQGNVFFAQTLEREDEPKHLDAVGTFEHLIPGHRYELTVHSSGDISDNCAFIGKEYTALGGAKFTADKDGKALLLIQNRDVLLEGTASVLGRSVVVTPVGGGKPTCGVIARNIVTRFKVDGKISFTENNLIN